jgi:hypothetical protein
MCHGATIAVMKQQTAFFAACGITAFLLVGGSAVVTNWRSQSADAAPAIDAASSTPTAAATPERVIFLAREAAYQQRLAEANQRLVEAQAETAAIATRAAIAPTAVPLDEPAPTARTRTDSTPRISTSEAARIAYIAALQHAADPQPQRAELVLFQGAVAYEILFSNGVVYVDAASGAVLFSQWTPAAPAPTTTDLVAAAPPDMQPPPVAEAPAPPAGDDEAAQPDEEHHELEEHHAQEEDDHAQEGEHQDEQDEVHEDD